jgi:hypothetical protein
MNKVLDMPLKIRVCGEETMSLSLPGGGAQWETQFISLSSAAPEISN